MKKLIIVLFMLGLSAFGQTNNFAAAGISYNPGASPSIAGTGLYARLIAGSGTYAFTVVDALPTSTKPFSVQTAFSAGLAQKLTTMTFGKLEVPIYIPTAAGISYTGSNTGWQASTGALALIPIGKTWRVAPSLRMVKSSVGSDGYQVIGGLMIGWGW